MGKRTSEFLGPPFLVAVGLLGAAALLAGPVASRWDMRLSKEALPLKKPLGAFEPTALYPYRVVERQVLEPAVEDALDTREYLNWVLEDTSVSGDHPLRYVHLFVTYYTGGSNLVPHVPDVCYLGSGYRPKQQHENRQVTLNPPGGSAVLPVRLCTFVKTAVFNRDELSVVYTFFANGGFFNTRTGVRLAINDPTDTYAFFSKVEVSFPRATREQSLEGAARVFERVVPVLMSDHWPDLEAAEAAASRS